MPQFNSLKILITGVAMVALVGCASKKEAEPYDSPDYIVNEEPAETNVGGENTKELLEQVTYYFEFDSSNLSDKYTASLEAHAQYLIAHPDQHVRLEGNTDERGSREYNVALGERRAQSVANVLYAEGVPGDQISIVSYGAERPAVEGHTESAWKFNRRTVIVYEGVPIIPFPDGGT